MLRLGAALIVLSGVLWLGLLVVPHWPAPAGALAAAAAALVVAAEVLWWAGVALLGPDTWRLARAQGLRKLPRALARLLRDGRPSPGLE